MTIDTDATSDDNPPEGGSETPPADETSPEGPPADGDKSDEWKRHARKHEAEAKRLRKELDEARKASMTDQEKAVEAARDEGRAAAMTETARQLASAEFRAAAAAAGVQLGEAADLVDVTKFIGDGGKVDAEAIGVAVTQLAALAKPVPASPTAGPQGSTKPTGSFLLKAIDAATV
jgi:hypothetical protein